MINGILAYDILSLDVMIRIQDYLQNHFPDLDLDPDLKSTQNYIYNI
jgi:hypothetical protein